MLRARPHLAPVAHVALKQHRQQEQARQDEADLAASAEALLGRLAVVNTELAAVAGRQE